MDFPASYNLIFILVSLYHTGVALTIVHLIFKTDYALNERLLWMVVLWVVPVLGLLAYWFLWSRRKV